MKNGKMKVIVSILLIAAMLLGMSACGTKEDEFMKSVYENFIKEGTTYAEIKEWYDIKDELNGDTITITYNDGEKTTKYDYIHNGDYIEITSANDDYFGSAMLLYMIDAIAEVNGMDPDEVTAYINGLFYFEIENDIYKSTDNGDGTDTASVYVKPFEMTELDKMVLTDDCFDEWDILDTMRMTQVMNLGKLHIYSYGNANDYTIYIGEHGGLTDIALKSLAAFVKGHQPVGYEAFLESFNGFDALSGEFYEACKVTDSSELVNEMGETSIIDKCEWYKVSFLDPDAIEDETFDPEIEEYITDDWFNEDDVLTSEDTWKLMLVNDIFVYCSGNKDHLVITLGEWGMLTDNAYQSILTVVRNLQPAGYENFLSEYTELEQKTGTGYTVEACSFDDIEFDEESGGKDMEEMLEDYQFMRVEFGK